MDYVLGIAHDQHPADCEADLSTSATTEFAASDASNIEWHAVNDDVPTTARYQAHRYCLAMRERR